MKTINTIKKVSLATLVTFVLSFSSVFAQNDTMYIMKSGAIVGQYNVNTEVDSVIFYKPFSQEQPQTAPIAGFTVSSTSTTTGSNISFTDTSTNTPTIWAWDFGDGSSSTQQNPSHAFSTAGTYMVTLTVSNENGSNTASKSITVTNSGSVSTDTAGTFTDSRDGNDYNWVKIGDQVWMAENLAYLPSVNMVADGSEDAAGSYYYVYGYDGTDVTAAKATANYTTYGVLYNWPAAMNACPDGWHLPSDAEWTELTDYLGGTSVAGGKLKETGTTHWASPNTGATNETGFTALPGGYRTNSGTFGHVGNDGGWWSATEDFANDAWSRGVYYGGSDVYRVGSNKELGFSVRCLRD